MPKGDEYEHKKREEALQRMRKGDKEGKADSEKKGNKYTFCSDNFV